MVTITTSTRYTTYEPEEETTNFEVGFPIFDNSDILLFCDGEAVAFTVSATYVDGISEDAVLVVDPGIVGFVEIIGRRSPRRTDQYTPGAPLPIRDHNYSLNRLTIESQEARRDADRAYKAPFGAAGGIIEQGTTGHLAQWTADGMGDTGITPYEVGLVAANMGAILDAPQYAEDAQEAAEATAADRIAVAADKSATEGYRDEVEADRVDVQADKVIASAAADAAALAQVAAEAARDATLAAYDNFDDRYLGAKAADPVEDNDGDPLVGGALYYNTSAEEMRLWTGSAWVAAYVSGGDFLVKSSNLADLPSPSTARTNLDVYSTDEIDALPGAVAAKTTPVDADSWQIWDSVASAWKRVTGTNLKVYLKAYFDTLYAAVTHSHTVAQLSDASANGRSLIAMTYANMVTALSAVTTARNVSTQHSLTGGGNLSADRTLSLVNDTASPGNSRYYGTDETGTRGYHEMPTGGGSAWTWLAPVALSGAATRDVTVPSTATELLVYIDGGSASSNGWHTLRLGDSGGVETTGYESNGANAGTDYGITDGIMMSPGSVTSANVCVASVHLFKVSGTDKWVGFGGTRITGSYGANIHASKELSAAITTVQARASAGNWDAGTLYVGYKE